MNCTIFFFDIEINMSWKLGFSEAGADAIMGSFGAELMTGNIELIAAEAAILGSIMAVKKIKEHHD
jgi:hypothetical protein